MARRGLLWSAFAVVHVLVAVLGRVLPNQPMGDVYLVYEPWATRAVSGQGIVGITEPWVYPALALVPMILAGSVSWILDYALGWAIVVTALDAVAFAILVGDARSRGRSLAAATWLVFALLLGPVGMFRIDAILVPLAIVGMLWVVGRPWAASVALAAATWIKVWPAALLVAIVIAVRRRWAVVGGAAAVSAAVVAVAVLAQGAGHVFGFVAQQTGRGLQLEAPVSTLYVWQAAAGVDGSFIYYDPEMLTFQVAGPRVDDVIAAMTPLLACVVAGIAALGVVMALRGARTVRLLPPLSLALVTALIVVNKVGSPQFLTWLIPPLVLWVVVDRARAWPLALLGVAAAAMTQLVYPLTYGLLLVADPVPVALLTVRNAMMVTLLVWSVIRVARVRAPGRTAVRIAPSRS